MWKEIRKFTWGIVVMIFIIVTVDSCIKAYKGLPVDLSWSSIIIMELNLIVSSILGLLDEYK